MRDLQRSRYALERIRRHIARTVCRHRRIHHTRAYAVDADRGRQFGGKSTRQIDDAALGSGIGCHLRRIRQKTLARCDIHDRRPGCLGQPWQTAAHDDVNPSQVYVDHTSPVGNPDLEYRTANNNAGAIDDAVDATHCGRAPFDGVCDRPLIGHVSRDGESAGLAGDLRQSFNAAVEQRQRCAFGSE